MARLPEAFRPLAPSGPWSHALNEETADELWLSHRAARRTVTLAECENDTRATLRRLRHGVAAAKQRPWDPMDGYSGRLDIVLFDDGAALVEGHAVGLSRCMSAVYWVAPGNHFSERLQVAVLDVMSGFSLSARNIPAADPVF